MAAILFAYKSRINEKGTSYKSVKLANQPGFVILSEAKNHYG